MRFNPEYGEGQASTRVSQGETVTKRTGRCGRQDRTERARGRTILPSGCVLGPFFLPTPTTTFTKRRLYCSRFFARPVSCFFFSCFATLGVCPRTLPARAREPWTLPLSTGREDAAHRRQCRAHSEGPEQRIGRCLRAMRTHVCTWSSCGWVGQGPPRAPHPPTLSATLHGPKLGEFRPRRPGAGEAAVADGWQGAHVCVV
jgi:hypothetical protein